VEQIAKYDDMVDSLSLARARGELCALEGTPAWNLYLEGRKLQIKIESELAQNLIAEGCGREQVIAEWMQQRAN
jgi:hypothetical protein